MSRTATLGLAMLIGLSSLTTPDALAQAPQVRSTLDAQFPSDHDYVVAVWYVKKDKKATFKYAIMDPSIPGNYNRRQWEDAKLAWNDPDKGTVMNIFPVRTSQNARQTERQQVMVRVEQERQRIDFIDKPTVDVKPIWEEKPKAEKKAQGKTTFGYDEKAKKSTEVGSLTGTLWVNRSGTMTYKFGQNNMFLDVDYRDNPPAEVYSGKWQQNGNTVRIEQSGSTITGTLVGNNGMKTRTNYGYEDYWSKK